MDPIPTIPLDPNLFTPWVPPPLRQARHESKRARKLQGRAERLQERIGTRLGLMADAGTRLPRLERLGSALQLLKGEILQFLSGL